MNSKDQETFDSYDRPNPRLIELTLDTPVDEPRILDIGCWRGALGRGILTHRKVLLEGVDINQASLDEAQSRGGYERIYCLDLNHTHFDEIPDESYDVIVCGDVLEHTIAPAKILECLQRKLKPDGHIVVSLPNIGFIWYRIQLLAGRWEYRDSGVMDRTHLKFFTYHSMRRFFRDLQPRLYIEKSRPYIGIANHPQVVQSTMRGLARLWPNLFALQVVFKLRPPVRH